MKNYTIEEYIALRHPLYETFLVEGVEVYKNCPSFGGNSYFLVNGKKISNKKLVVAEIRVIINKI